MCSFKTSEKIYPTMWCHILDDNVIYNQQCGDLMLNINMIICGLNFITILSTISKFPNHIYLNLRNYINLLHVFITRRLFLFYVPHVNSSEDSKCANFVYYCQPYIFWVHPSITSWKVDTRDKKMWTWQFVHNEGKYFAICFT